MTWVIIIIGLTYHGQDLGMQPSAIASAYFRSRDFCEAAKEDLIKQRPNDVIARCDPIGIPEDETPPNH